MPDIITPRYQEVKKEISDKESKGKATAFKAGGDTFSILNITQEQVFNFKKIGNQWPYIAVVGALISISIALFILNFKQNVASDFTFNEAPSDKQVSASSFVGKKDHSKIRDIKIDENVGIDTATLVNEDHSEQVEAKNNFGLAHKTVFLEPGSVLTASLEKAIEDKDGINMAVMAMRDVVDLRYLKPKQKIDFTYVPTNESTGESEKLQSVVISLSNIEKAVSFINKDGTFTAQKHQKNIDVEKVFSEGVVEADSSFYQAGINAGVPERLMMEMFDIFAFSVDFQRDVSVGDKFHIIYEKLFDSEGNEIGSGQPIAAQIKTGNTVYKTFGFLDDTGELNFYDEKGQGVRKALLLMPVSGGRLTSGYRVRRNPLYGYTELHPALDFAAPRGTPIMAAGDGYVKHRGWMPRGYGNYVILSHDNGYETLYGHMSGFARSAPVGTRVRQGQTIGYVGTTGMSTGNHLHYEIRKGKQRFNPAIIVRRMRSGRNLNDSEREKFFAEIGPYLSQFDGALK